MHFSVYALVILSLHISVMHTHVLRFTIYSLCSVDTSWRCILFCYPEKYNYRLLSSLLIMNVEAERINRTNLFHGNVWNFITLILCTTHHVWCQPSKMKRSVWEKWCISWRLVQDFGLKMCMYINLKDSDQPIQLDNTIFRTTGTYNFVCMEMWSKADSMESNYNKITAVDIHTTFSKYRQIIFSCQDDNGIPLVHNTVDIKSAHTVKEKLSGFNTSEKGGHSCLDGVFALDLNAWCTGFHNDILFGVGKICLLRGVESHSPKTDWNIGSPSTNFVVASNGNVAM